MIVYLLDESWGLQGCALQPLGPKPLRMALPDTLGDDEGRNARAHQQLHKAVVLSCLC